MCEVHIKDTIRNTVPGAEKIKASRKKGEVTFFTENHIDSAALKSAIEGTGYKMVYCFTEPFGKAD